MTDTATNLLFFKKYFSEFYNDAKVVLPHLDSLLQATANGVVFRSREYFKGTDYTSGHVPGTYMGYYIEKNGL